MRYLIILSGFLLLSCDYSHKCFENKKRYIAYFGDNKIDIKGFVQKTTTNEETHASLGFFLFVGGGNYEKKTVEKTEVLFYWRNPQSDTFKLERKPLDFFKIKIDNKIKNPYLSFVFYEDLHYYGQLSTFDSIDDYRIEDPEQLYNVRCIIVHCNENHWKPRFKLPLE